MTGDSTPFPPLTRTGNTTATSRKTSIVKFIRAKLHLLDLNFIGDSYSCSRDEVIHNRRFHSRHVKLSFARRCSMHFCDDWVDLPANPQISNDIDTRTEENGNEHLPRDQKWRGYKSHSRNHCSIQNHNPKLRLKKLSCVKWGLRTKYCTLASAVVTSHEGIAIRYWFTTNGQNGLLGPWPMRSFNWD